MNIGAIRDIYKLLIDHTRWAHASPPSDVKKDWTCKDKDKDQAYKDQDKDKD